jgi:putative effector of murein hydrolase LrgA (UPF0299 family)
MIEALCLLLGAQLAGEMLVRLFHLPLPGPVLGLVLALALFALRGGVPGETESVALGVLRNLSLLFVPAGVGIVQQTGVLKADGFALFGAILISTVLTLAVTAGVFVGVSRLTSGRKDSRE